MKTTDRFKEAIEQHLKYRGFKDPLFAETLKKPNKNIEECINYILNEVQKSGINGYAEEEIYNMAVHYYDEDDIKSNDRPAVKVVINKQIKLTKEEIAEAKKEAREQVIAEEKQRMLGKNKPSKPKAETKVQSNTLF